MALARRIAGWILVAGYMGLIFHLSSKPAIEIPPLFPHQDKVFHLCEYFGLGFLSAFAFDRGSIRSRFLFGFLLASVYGISDEIHQSFVPGRDASVWDFMADAIGAWIGAWAYLRAEIFVRSRRKD